MRYLFLVMVCCSLLIACGGGRVEAVPTLAATAVLDTDGGVVSPRATETPSSSLPPTWTPEPAGAAGHLATAEPTAVVTRVVHVVQRNETLGEIAELYGVSVADIAAANDIANIDVIEVGDQLVIP